jgi:hypothetical protein
MPKVEKEMAEMIVFKAPKELRQKLEEYCQKNGVSLSYAVRRCLEAEIINPKLPTQAELWNEMLNWKDWVNKKLGEIVSLISESWKLNQGDVKKLAEISEGLFKGQERIADCLNNINLQIQTLDFQIEVLFRILEKLTGQPIRQILNETLEEWKAKKKAEKGDEKNE